MSADRLRDLVLVMRELQVDAAAMDVDGVAERGFTHRRAFDVPARATAAPGRVPARQFRRRRLPQHEVAGIALVRRHLDAGAGQHLVGGTARQLPVLRISLDREQHVALGGVGVAGLDQAFAHRDDLRNVRGRVRLKIRQVDAECAHVRAIGVRELVGDRRNRYLLVDRRLVDLVVDVSDVAGVDELRIVAAQQARQHAEHDRTARVADVHIVVNRRPADIHADPVRIHRREGFDAAGQGIEQVQGHCGHLG